MVFGALSIFSLAVGGCVLALLGLWISQQLSWSRKIPGPIAAKYTRWWYMWQIYSNDFHWTNIKLHRQNGTLCSHQSSITMFQEKKKKKELAKLDHCSEWLEQGRLSRSCRATLPSTIRDRIRSSMDTRHPGSKENSMTHGTLGPTPVSPTSSQRGSPRIMLPCGARWQQCIL